MTTTLPEHYFLVIIQAAITLHPIVAPHLVAAAYAKSMPRASISSLRGLPCSDGLYRDSIE